MDATQIAVLPHSGPIAGRRIFVVISLAALVATAFFVGVALPYLALDPKVLARYGSRGVWVLVLQGRKIFVKRVSV
jgi:hypothetical protein